MRTARRRLTDSVHDELDFAIQFHYVCLKANMKRVLILCTGNSCRSQMAEAIWRKLAGADWEVHSAGSRPAGYVHPLAIRVMGEWEIDLSNSESKSVDRFQNVHFDLVVTVCDNARESCPLFTGTTESLHWPFDDPADATGTDLEQLPTFRRVRDEIKARIEDYLATSKTAAP